MGGATAIGEQPIKGLVDAACGARMAVGEALTNLVFAPITDLKVRCCLRTCHLSFLSALHELHVFYAFLKFMILLNVLSAQDVKCSGNWMWAAKLEGEGALLYDACAAMCEVMGQLGVAVDGGKDSLSMAARVGGQTVKAPGALVVSTYAGCPDITKTVTPDLKDIAGKFIS